MKMISLFLCALLLASVGLCAQDQAPPALPPPGQSLTPEQVDDLVAPVALYPDPLLGQVLAASTYPLEIVQASQWLQRNPGLAGPALTAAAQQQNWDPSVQALVVFPDVLKSLASDITWVTNLGNAFLSQQQDVMDAVQRMRQQAQQAGKLAPTPQLNVVSENEGGYPYIEILPVDPDMIYVPWYDPVWIWGPPRWYPYPRWHWPPRGIIVGGLGFGFGGGINIGLFFGASWHGWMGWGWQPNWGNRTVMLNSAFIHQYNFNAAHLASAHGVSVWAHDPAHRQGVPYATVALNDRFRGSVRQNVEPRSVPAAVRNAPQQQAERLGNRQMPKNVAPAQNRSVFSGMDNGRAAQTHAEHGFSSMGAARSAPMPTMRSAPAPAARAGGGRR
jgi:hypothetical protein